MKRIMIITLLCMLTAGLYAAGKENNSYVKANGKTYFGTEIRMGIVNTTIITSDGEKIKLQNTDIQTVMHNGRLFERLPVVCKKKHITCMAMMEYITSKDGLRLYRYNCFNKRCDPVNGVIVNTYPEDVYYVFKDGNFYLRIDETNAVSALPFFGIEIRN